MNAIIRHETPKSETKEFLTSSIESRLRSCLYQFFSFFLIFLYLFGLLGLSGGTWGLQFLLQNAQPFSCAMGSSSLTRVRSRTPCIGSGKFQPLDHQGRPCQCQQIFKSHQGEAESLEWMAAAHSGLVLPLRNTDLGESTSCIAFLQFALQRDIISFQGYLELTANIPCKEWSGS